MDSKKTIKAEPGVAIINRKATKMFAELLKKINYELDRRRR